MRYWLHDEKKALLQLRKEGLSFSECGKELNRSRSSVASKLNQLKGYKRGYREDKRQSLTGMRKYDKGHFNLIEPWAVLHARKKKERERSKALSCTSQDASQSPAK